jgi:hypothetical protein
MQRCPRCSTFVEADWGYCPVCGRPRILESLRTPEPQPAWHEPALKGLVGLVTVWFLVTLGVAFLREWKAVRDSRELLDQGQTQEAWNLLEPFLPRHPKHRQAVFLSGKAAIRLNKHLEARQFLDTLGELSPELVEELGGDYRQVLAGRARAVGCDASVFQTLLGSAEMIGPPYAETVMTGLHGVVSTCRANGGDYALRSLAQELNERGRGLGLVEHGYAPAIESAIGQRRYDEARALARQVGYLVPDGWAAVEKALADERRKVSETVATIARLCDEIGAGASRDAGGSRCFPVQAPAAAVAARDGWGRNILYSPLFPGSSARCFGGFTLTSYGADGIQTDGDPGSPSREIVCRNAYGRKNWQVPDRFWHLPEE